MRVFCREPILSLAAACHLSARGRWPARQSRSATVQVPCPPAAAMHDACRSSYRRACALDTSSKPVKRPRLNSSQYRLIWTLLFRRLDLLSTNSLLLQQCSSLHRLQPAAGDLVQNRQRWAVRLLFGGKSTIVQLWLPSRNVAVDKTYIHWRLAFAICTRTRG